MVVAAVGLDEGAPGEELARSGGGVWLEGEEWGEGVDWGEGECGAVFWACCCGGERGL